VSAVIGQDDVAVTAERIPIMSRPDIRVLVVEDSPSDAELIRIGLSRELSAVYIVTYVETLQAGLDVLRERSFDVLLVDLNLPDSAGIETCERLSQVVPAMPIIVLTGLDNDDLALQAVQAGAQDYLVKDQINGSLLSRSIRYAIERRRASDYQCQQDSRLRLISEQLPAVMWTTDRELRITPPTRHFLVKGPREPLATGMTLPEYFRNSSSDFAPVAAHLRALQGHPVTFDFRWKGRSLTVHVEPLRDAAGTIIGTIGVSLDISRQKRMQEELTAAGQVQQALFPKVAPQLPRFDIAGAVFPAEETAGDYFDFIAMPDGRLGLVVGDVAGHGLGPALLIAELRACLRLLSGQETETGGILERANLFLAADLEDFRFVTLFFAALDPQQSRFTCAAAGHVAYLLRANGSVESLESTGYPLGLMDSTTFGTHGPIDLCPGDLLLINTDGFPEARTGDQELFSVPRMLDYVARHRMEPSGCIINGLREEVCRFTQSPVTPDDMSAIIVRRLSEA